jgi:hypothetical protein
MAAMATLTAVLGFVMQFVGLRALHWSATIYQLGIMLILTIIRSLVRRGLAEDPDFYPLLDGHELAWLTLYIVGKDKQGWNAEKPDQWVEPEPEELMLKGLVRWEPITGNYNVKEVRQLFSQDDVDPDTIEKDEVVSRLLRIEHTRLTQAFHPLSGSMIRGDKISTDGASETLGICRDLQRLMSTSSEVKDAATTLARAIERTMTVLGEGGRVLWREGHDPFQQRKEVVFDIDLVGGTYESGSVADLQKLTLSVTGPDNGVSDRDDTLWTIDRELISSVICLWVFSLELRRNAARKLAVTARKLMARRRRSQDLRGLELGTKLFTRREAYFRIVAPSIITNDGQSDRLKRFELTSRWLRDPIEELPVLGEFYQELGENLPEAEPMDNTWVVWGLRNSTLLK